MSSNRFLSVRWLHDYPREPVLLVSEIGSDGFEVRKVEIFRDGTKGYASREESIGMTWLGERPVPRIEEIASNPEFEPNWITESDFNTIWVKRKDTADVYQTAGFSGPHRSKLLHVIQKSSIYTLSKYNCRTGSNTGNLLISGRFLSR
jgi:hypothetical protein